jgi:hypothetical protein
MSRDQLAGLLTFVSIGVLAGCSDRSPTDSKPRFLGVPNLPGVAPPALSSMGSLTLRLATVQVAVKNDHVCVGGETILLIQDVVPWGALVPPDQDPLGADVTELIAQDKAFCMITSDQIGSTDLSTFKEIIIPSDQNQTYYDNLFPGVPVGVIRQDITKWVVDGGVLSANLADVGFNLGTWEGKIFIGGVQHVVQPSDLNDINDPDHPIIEDNLPCGSNGHCGPIKDAGFQNDLDGWSFSSHGYFTNTCADTKVIIVDEFQNPVMIEYGVGAGRVVANLNTLEWRYYGPGGTPEKKLLANEIAYQDAIACNRV